MMNGFEAKSSVIAALLVLLLMGGFPETSALIPVGGKEFYGSRKTLPRRESCFGIECQSMDIFHDHKGSQMLGLRLRSLQPPPAPTKGQVHAFSIPPAPPPPAN